MAILISVPGVSSGVSASPAPIAVVAAFAGYSQTPYGTSFASFNDSGEAVLQDAECILSGQADAAQANRLSSLAFDNIPVANGSSVTV